MIIPIIIIIFLYWYFNIRSNEVLRIDIPLEKMTNISIFEN